MKITELLEAKDPYVWIEKAVHKILDSGDSAAILKKTDKDIVALVQGAKSAGDLHYAPTQRILPYVQSWRAKQEVTEEVDTIDSIDKKIEFHKKGQAAVSYAGPMNKRHSDSIKKLLAARNKLVQQQNFDIKEEQRFPPAISGWFVVKKDTDELVSRPFASKDKAQEHLMTKMFSNHHLYTVKKFDEVAEGEVVSARFGAKGALHDTGIKVPPGYDRFKLDGQIIFGLRDGKWLKISSISDKKVGRELVKAYNQGGLTDSGLKPISLMQAFGSDELAALDAEGIKLTEKPGHWNDFEEGGQSEKRNIHEVKLKKIEKTIGKLPVIDAADIYGGPLKPKGPMSSVRMMPDEQMFIVKFDDGTKYLVDRTGAKTYIRFWQKII